jgi:hypothetical protein
MKAELALLAISSLIVLAATVAPAQDNLINTNSLPLNQTVKYQNALENDRSKGERALLPPGLKEKLKLTDEQRDELKPIEDDFAKTAKQYQTANQGRIDAALESERQARLSKDPDKIAGARHQLQLAWAGLQPYRVAGVKAVAPLLTPDQVAILEDARNQWRENHGSEANDPSAH